MEDPILVVACVGLVLFTLFTLLAVAQSMLVGRPWMRATMHGAPVSVFDILGMRMRGNPPELLIDAYITLKRAGVAATITDVENAYIDGRNSILNSDDLAARVQKSQPAH